ncbi:hypothetical protein CK203_100786 [Vitis vinifera]|uniref:Uncharacterized protein n=1 Tax=Vitis vinifera TaxID=29760 RepID=A0A438CJJ1_VITVI|nr:hypothetical protein CK203_100786 [Vitis vinifera]
MFRVGFSLMIHPENLAFEWCFSRCLKKNPENYLMKNFGVVDLNVKPFHLHQVAE